MVAFALALLIATLGAAANAAAGEHEAAQANRGTRVTDGQSFEGMVTCTHCGVKHSAVLDRSASACVRVCVHGGAGFALVSDESTYVLDGDLDVLKKLAGQRAAVVGVRNGQTIKVASAMAKSL